MLANNINSIMMFDTTEYNSIGSRVSLRHSKRQRTYYSDTKRRTKRHKCVMLSIKDETSIIPLVETTTNDKILWNTWVSAISTRNYLLKDPLLDWLDCYYINMDMSNIRTRRHCDNSNNERTVKMSKTHTSKFTKFIMNQGIEFEKNVIKLLYLKFTDSCIYDVGGSFNATSKVKYNDTLDAMKRGVPIIYNGVLHNTDDYTFGVPDLIVRSDYINKLVDINCVPDDEKNIGPYGNDVKYHYRIVDIKYSTMSLRSDGVHMLNSNNTLAVKGQLCIYNNALTKSQGYDSGVSYVLGRKWAYTKKGIKYSGNGCFDRLGSINFITVDYDYIKKTNNAVKWVKEVRNCGHKWNPLVNTSKRWELYPNMSNAYDGNWNGVKKHIAECIGEITSVWRCGISARCKAHSNGIYKWTDPNCTSEILGMFNAKTKNVTKTGKVITEILKTNRNERTEYVYPKVITNNVFNWKNKDVEFYVDFETVSNIVYGFDELPISSDVSIIFMIGVGYIDPKTNDWIYKDFTVNKLNLEEEKVICLDFLTYIDDKIKLLKPNNRDDVKLIHWGHAEKSHWANAINHHPELSNMVDFNWFDLLKVFRAEPITIKGCLSFGLKGISKALHKYGKIATIWNTDGEMSDGISAMLAAYETHIESIERGISMKVMPVTKSIVRYNEIDCKVLYEIIEYLRNNHC